QFKSFRRKLGGKLGFPPFHLNGRISTYENAAEADEWSGRNLNKNLNKGRMNSGLQRWWISDMRDEEFAESQGGLVSTHLETSLVGFRISQKTSCREFADSSFRLMKLLKRSRMKRSVSPPTECYFGSLLLKSVYHYYIGECVYKSVMDNFPLVVLMQPTNFQTFLVIGKFPIWNSSTTRAFRTSPCSKVLLAVLNGTELMEAVIMIYLLRRSKPMWQDSVKKRLCFDACDSAKIVADAVISDFNEVLEAVARYPSFYGAIDGLCNNY
ncbi:hypothetical protein QQP08_021273, partial [Theobroma cacao]